MASKTLATSLLLTLNLLFLFITLSSCATCPSSTVPTPTPTPTPKPKPPTTPPVPMPSASPPSSSPTPKPKPPTTPPVPMPSASPPSSSQGNCPIDALKLRVCANVLNLGTIIIGSPPTTQCCSLISGLVDLDAAACLCTALKANILGINLDISHSLSVILNKCGKNNSGYQCT